MSEPTDHGSVEASRLAGTTWLAEDIGGAGVLDHFRCALAFTPDGYVHGHGGVNRFRGSYRVAGRTIEFGPIAVTRMAGPEAAMRQEERFLAALSGTRSLHQVEDLLVIDDGAGAVTLHRTHDEAGSTTG